MGTKILKAYGVGQPTIDVFPKPIIAEKAPATTDLDYPIGQKWIYNNDEYTNMGDGVWDLAGIGDASTTQKGVVRLATVAETTAGILDTVATTPAGVAAVAIAGAPDWSEVQKGIAQIATTADAQAGTSNTLGMTPAKVVDLLKTPPAIGGTTPGNGTFKALTTDGTGAVSLAANAASDFTVTGADLTLQSSGQAVNIASDQAAADAISIQASAGGLDLDTALLLSLVSSRNNAQAIQIEATAGGIDILASGASAGEDIDITATGSSVNITSTENVSDGLTLTATGGIVATATGGAGKDIALTNTNGSVQLTAGEAVADAILLNASAGGLEAFCAGQAYVKSTQNAVDAVKIESTQGGIQILASGAAATKDIVLTATGSSITATATEDAALNIYLHANGGTSETIKIHSDQGTGAASVGLFSDVGGITLNSGLAAATAINITSSAAGGGWTLNSGTAGVTLTNTGKLSLAAAAASDITVTGAFDLTLATTAGSLNLSAGEAAADSISIQAAAGGIDWNSALQSNIDSSQAAVDAIRIIASGVAGGIDMDCGTGGATLDSTGAISIDAAGASNFSTSSGDLSLIASTNSVVITGAEAAVDAVQVNASNAAGGIDINAGTGGITIDTTGLLSIDSQGVTNLTATGAFDLTVQSTAGSVVVSGGEAVQDAIQLLSPAGGIKMLQAGGAGLDTTITNTSGSITITAGESASDAFNLTASGAASGMTLTAGTAGITFSSGQIVKVTSVATAASPYTILGTDYFIACDSTAGIMTVTLPAAPATGRYVIVADAVGQAGANAITIDGNGKSISLGASAAGTKSIGTNYKAVGLIYNGTLWTGFSLA